MFATIRMQLWCFTPQVSRGFIMNAVIQPKNWGEFQHYKDRSPTWIKLHKSILDNYDYQRLPLASKALAPMLWLLASEYDEGKIPLDYDLISFRLRTNVEDLKSALSPLIKSGFFLLNQDASNVLAECLPREEDIKHINLEEKEKSLVALKPRPSKKAPADFQLTPALLEWAYAQGIPEAVARRETEAFMDYTFKTARTDWEGTWRNWMRKSKGASPNAITKEVLGLADQVMQTHYRNQELKQCQP
jgi:hypothetical protein